MSHNTEEIIISKGLIEHRITPREAVELAADLIEHVRGWTEDASRELMS